MNKQLAASRPIEVLLAEDNDDDVELTRQGLKRGRLLVNLHRVRDGEECLAFLRKKGAYLQAATPDLVLLDLNMPRVNGREVLAEMMGDEALSSMPVVILTTCEQDEEVLRMYKMRCNSFIVKPVDFDQFLRVIRTISDYWFTVVVLPKTAHTLTGQDTARSP